MQYSRSSRIYVTHHCVESTFTFLENMPECIDMALVHVHVGICWEFHCLPFTRTPLIESGIQLILKLVYQTDQKKIRLTAVATRATIGMGTSRLLTPSLPRWYGKDCPYLVTKEVDPPVKYKSRMTAIIRSFRYGCERFVRPCGRCQHGS